MEARLYVRLEDNKVACNLCAHRCIIKDGQRGRCQVRENRAGTLNTLVYGSLITRHVDPIEKKPIFHMLPDTLAYSIATVGCNFTCRFCQNADIAQLPRNHNGTIYGTPSTPARVVGEALAKGCASIAYTYTEPTVFFEFAYDTARLAREKGLKNIFVTNGYMSAEALDLIGPFLDAANVDLKAYRDTFYQEQCGAHLAPVKETLERMAQMDLLVEVTTLLIPGLNTDRTELTALADFLVTRMGPDTPWHISRFHPTYKLTNRAATPTEELTAAREIGLAAGLKYVYTGNVWADNNGGEHTYCKQCGTRLIDRTGFIVNRNHIRDGKCPDCGSPVPGVGMDG